jgi:translation initiation factor 3 subunit D
MVIDYKEMAEDLEHGNPFEDEDEGSAACGAYRYRKITIPGNAKEDSDFNQRPMSLVVRTEVNAKTVSAGGQPQFCSIKVLNEYDPKLNSSWRDKLESQRGAILATELKNNAFKIGRWTAQAILSGCEVMKLGYASRNDPKDPWSHSILSVQTHVTDRFAEQIGMHGNNVYGIIRSIVNMVMTWDDGKYLLIKDPMKSVIRFYDIPWETFADDDGGEDEEEAEDDGPELDEEGRPLPEQQR